MKTGKVVLGTLAGLAIGALAGILFAPEKGSTTRQQIKDKSDDYADDLKAMFNEYRNSFTEKFKSAKKDAQNLVENGKSEYDDAKRVVKNVATNFKHDVAAY
jgi:gas vesicle protein